MDNFICPDISVMKKKSIYVYYALKFRNKT